MLTPRGGQSKDWAAALQDATKKWVGADSSNGCSNSLRACLTNHWCPTHPRRRREAHAARNTALMTEMCRQRHAFALALQDVVATSVAEAGGSALGLVLTSCFDDRRS
jgi:hypothetical protein